MISKTYIFALCVLTFLFMVSFTGIWVLGIDGFVAWDYVTIAAHVIFVTVACLWFNKNVKRHAIEQ